MHEEGAGYARVAAIIPARNEVENVPAVVLPLLNMGLGQVIVVDNGSNDGTGRVASALGANVVREERAGYGAACWKGMQALNPGTDVVLFVDADQSDDLSVVPCIVDPVLHGEADLVMGARTRCESGAMTLPQRFGTALAVRLVHVIWGHPFADLGPFRAINRAALEDLEMKDRAFGWTVEMQIRALQEGLRTMEIPVRYFPRVGTSKISGTIRGVALAGYWILSTILRLRLAEVTKAHPRRTPRGSGTKLRWTQS